MLWRAAEWLNASKPSLVWWLQQGIKTIDPQPQGRVTEAMGTQ